MSKPNTPKSTAGRLFPPIDEASPIAEPTQDPSGLPTLPDSPGSVRRDSDASLAYAFSGMAVNQDGYDPAGYAQGPFANPRPHQRDSIASDVSMGQFSATAAPSPGRAPQTAYVPPAPTPGAVYRTAPTPPTPPLYVGTTAADKKQMMRDYQQYWWACMALRQQGVDIVIMHLGACVSDERRRTIATYEMFRPLEEITEEHWRAYFDAGNAVGIIDYSRVDKAMANLRMSTRHADPESRLNTLMQQLVRQLEQLSMEFFLKEEQKRVTGYLIAALAPPAFKASIEDELKRTALKPLRSNVVNFLRWRMTSLTSYMRWERAEMSATNRGINALQAPRHQRDRADETHGRQQQERRDDRGAQRHVRGGRGSGGGRGHNGGRGNGGRGYNGGRGGYGGRGGHESRPIQASRSNMTYTPPAYSDNNLRANLARMNDAFSGDTARRTARFNLSAVLAQASANEDAATDVPTGYVTGRVDDLLVVPYVLLDSGADLSIVNKTLVTQLVAMGGECTLHATEPLVLESFTGAPTTVSDCVSIKILALDAAAGTLTLKNLQAYVVDDESATPRVILARSVMQRLGYSTADLLDTAQQLQASVDLSPFAMGQDLRPFFTQVPVTVAAGYLSPPDGADVYHPERVVAIPPKRHDSSEPQATRSAAPLDEAVPRDDDLDPDSRVELPRLGTHDAVKVRALLAVRLQMAADWGLAGADLQRLADMLAKYQDVFRLSFGSDPPVKVPPLEVRLLPGVSLAKTVARRYSPTQQQFLESHCAELEAAGLIYRNMASRWASPPRLVPKPDGTLRMTVDTRAVNARTERLIWPMPQLDVVLGYLGGSECFFMLDWFRGYWQLPLAPNSQEFFTIMTHRGMYTPTRVSMGGSDSVGYCQATVEYMFKDLLYQGILAWLDDILGYSSTIDGLLTLLERVFEICARVGLKLHPNKCSFFVREAKWCGKVISQSGIMHDPARVAGLVDMAPPTTAAELQTFLCCANWMRGHIPHFSRLVAPLLKLLDNAASKAGSRKGIKLAKIPLDRCGWERVHSACFNLVKQALLDMVPLGHPMPGYVVSLFSDASIHFWGAVVTQTPPEDAALPLAEQRHQPLAYLSGRFAGSSQHWPIPDKEAYSIVEPVKKLEYILQRPEGFTVYTDHRNLAYLFNPLATDSNMQRHQADRLTRWAMVLTSYLYTIVHVPGELNVWADMLSRWARTDEPLQVAAVAPRSILATAMIAPPTSFAVFLLAIPPPAPLLAADFIWPDAAEILAAQRAHCALHPTPDGFQVSPTTACLVDAQGRTWIPSGCTDLQLRLCVIAHAGASGHRGIRVTTDTLREVYFWTTLTKDVEHFVRGCLQCLSVGQRIIPRPFGEQLHATKPNELLHFDFLQLPEERTTKYKYILTIKDDATAYAMFVPSVDATAAACASGLLKWFGLFGVVHTWVSDRGAHFKNEVISVLADRLGAQHHFTTAYSPWANGTVEVLNRQFLVCVKKLLVERRLDPNDWNVVLPIVQVALNHQPSERLGGLSPTTAFTGLPSLTPIRATLCVAEDILVLSLADISAATLAELAAVRLALDDMHRSIATTSAALRSKARASRAAKTKLPNFSIGDFVLVALVSDPLPKLTLIWRGPKRIRTVLSDWVFEVEDIVAPFAVSTHHASRLCFYADNSLNVTMALEDHAHYANGGHIVRGFAQVKPVGHSFALQVLWLGLEDAEATWEPLENLLEDVPAAVYMFLHNSKTLPHVPAALARAMKFRGALPPPKPRRARK